MQTESLNANHGATMNRMYYMRTSKINRAILFTVIIFCFIGKCYGNSEFPVLNGPYFGQNPPSLTPELFAPSIISINGRDEYGISFSPNLDEVYFSAQEKEKVASIYFSQIKNGKWQPINKLNLTNSEKEGEMHPFVSYNGERLFFTAYNSDFSDTKIWTANRTYTGWGKAIKLNSPINNREVFYSVLTNNDDLFYTDIYKSKTYYSSLQNDKYSKAKEVEIEFGLHAYVSPSQDYLLVDAVAKSENRTDKDIYVYFKKSDGTWSTPINLGNAVNSKFYETVPSITPDGKYLFFSRYNEGDSSISNLYWVSTKVIEQLRPKN